MNAPELLNLMLYLASLKNRTPQQERLLNELSEVNEQVQFQGKANESLNVANGHCPACGRKY